MFTKTPNKTNNPKSFHSVFIGNKGRIKESFSEKKLSAPLKHLLCQNPCNIKVTMMDEFNEAHIISFLYGGLS